MGGLNIKDVLLDGVMRTVRNQIEKPLQALEIENPIAYNFLSSRHQLCKHDACLIMLYHIQNDFEFELLIVGYNKKNCDMGMSNCWPCKLKSTFSEIFAMEGISKNAKFCLIQFSE